MIRFALPIEKAKRPLKNRGRSNAMRLGQLVQLQGDAALLAGSGILMQNSLLDRHVNGLDGSLVSAIGLLTVAFSNGSVELLQVGFQDRLSSSVLFVANSSTQNVLLRRLNVGHRYTSSNSVTWEHKISLMQKYIIAKGFSEIKCYFCIF